MEPPYGRATPYALVWAGSEEAPPSDYDFRKLASEEIATLIALFEKAEVEPEARTETAVN